MTIGRSDPNSRRRRPRPHLTTVAALLVIGAAWATGLPSTAASAAPVAKPTASPGSPRPQAVQPAPRLPRGARAVGAVAPSAKITGDLVLKPRDNPAITRFIAQVTDRNSPMFHHYLPAGVFARRFGPAKATISRAVSLFKGSGLRVTSVSRDGLLIHFAGTSQAISHAFHIKLENYRLRDGLLGRATTSAVRLPAAIAGSVAAVLGLNDLVRLQPEGVKRAPAEDRGKIPAAGPARFVRPAAAPAHDLGRRRAASRLGQRRVDPGCRGCVRAGSGREHRRVHRAEPRF